MLLPALLLAQTDACPATPAPLPPALAGWSASTAISVGDAQPASIALGQGVRATLRPAAAIRPAVAPGRPAAPTSFAGLFAFDAPVAGRYRVALGAGAWIELVRDGRALASVAHGHGPACSPVRKMVDFDLAPGRYVLQVTGAAAPTLDLMVARLP